jgi:hypothetical protein
MRFIALLQGVYCLITGIWPIYLVDAVVHVALATAWILALTQYILHRRSAAFKQS